MVPSWLPERRSAFYLYFGHHSGEYIRLALADRVEGPWRLHHGAHVLSLSDAKGCDKHVDSPSVHVDEQRRRLLLLFHCVVPGRGPKPGMHDYPLLNAIGLNLSRAVGATFLDVTTMLASRPDGHMPHDCGHWCLPGPYDLGPQLLYNAIIGHIDEPISVIGRKRLLVSD